MVVVVVRVRVDDGGTSPLLSSPLLSSPLLSSPLLSSPLPYARLSRIDLDGWIDLCLSMFIDVYRSRNREESELIMYGVHVDIIEKAMFNVFLLLFSAN